MNNKLGYMLDHVGKRIIITREFAKTVTVYGSTEYNLFTKLRADHPTYAIEKHEIRKKTGKRTYKGLSFERMEKYIETREGNDSERLKEFKELKARTEGMKGHYAKVKTWFLSIYKEEINNGFIPENI